MPTPQTYKIATYMLNSIFSSQANLNKLNDSISKSF